MSRKNPSSSPAGGQSRLASTLAVPRRYGAIVLACALLGFGVGYVVSLLQPKKYASTSEVLVRDPAMAEVIQDVHRLVATQIEVIESGPVSALARDKLAAQGFGEPLSGVLEVRRAPASDVVYVTATHRSPTRARDVAQAVADAYVERNRGTTSPTSPLRRRRSGAGSTPSGGRHRGSKATSPSPSSGPPRPRPSPPFGRRSKD